MDITAGDLVTYAPSDLAGGHGRVMEVHYGGTLRILDSETLAWVWLFSDSVQKVEESE